jgi:hypothetical protein
VLRFPLVLENALISAVIIKLTVGEVKELMKYEMGPFGEKGFRQFMAGLCARIDGDTGEMDLDDDDFRALNNYRFKGHRRVLNKIFKRPIDDAMRKFLGN